MDNSSNQPNAETSDTPEATKKPKAKKEISVVSVPHDNDVMANMGVQSLKEIRS